MAHPPEIRHKLRAAYIGGLPLDQAAQKIGVPPGTARNWYREARDSGDDWDKFQAASLVVAGGGIEAALGRVIAAGLVRCEALLEKTASEHDPECPPEDPAADVKTLAVLANTVAKLRAASKTMMPQADRLGVAMAVLKMMHEHLKQTSPHLGDAFAEALEPIGREIARIYG